MRSTVHRPGYLDYVGIKLFDSRGPPDRREAVSRPVDLGRLQRQSARHPAAAPQGRAGRPAFRARAGQPRRQGAAAHPRVLSARRTVPGERAGAHHASSPASSACRSGRACACWCAAIRSAASTRAWCSCRARNTTPQVRQRIEKVVSDAFGALSMESQVQIAESNLARIHIVARTAPGERGARRPRRARAAHRARRSARGPTASRRRCSARFDEAYALALFDALRAGVSRRLHRGFRAAMPPRSTWRFLEAADKEPASAAPRPVPARPRRRDRFFLKIFRGREAMPISDLLPMLENMGLKVIAERPYELEFARRRAAPGSRTSNSASQAPPVHRTSKRSTARSRARSPPSGPAAWTTTASTS